MKTKALIYIISSEQAPAKGERADRVLSRLEGLPSRSQLKLWFENSRIRRGLESLEPNSKIFPDDKIELMPMVSAPHNLEPKKMELKIFHEDEDLIVLYKPKGLSMHPGASKNPEATLVHGLLFHSKKLSTKSGEFRAGIVHRLDKDTEGIVVVAKNNEVHDALSKQFSERSIDRAYWALVYGKFPAKLQIDAPIGRHPKDRKKMAVVQGDRGKPSSTQAKLIQYFSENYSLVECKLMSGRTHQIRVHLSHKGYPLLGDPVYSRARKMKWSDAKEDAFRNLKGQALCAFRLGFIHPVTKEKLKFEVEYPKWMKIFLKD
ncbi:MAG: RluA family pseudouridine synthase [Deltaproteobacteria bacterium]|nr:RluA family pseudouridine synthase [Deltaproteobacteria bacterium]